MAQGGTKLRCNNCHWEDVVFYDVPPPVHAHHAVYEKIDILKKNYNKIVFQNKYKCKDELNFLFFQVKY